LSSPRVALVCCPEENRREEQRELLHYKAGKNKERNRERNVRKTEREMRESEDGSCASIYS